MEDPIRHPLVYARDQRGWSQTDLAVRMHRAARRHGLRSGTDRQRISKWEAGRRPSPESQLLMAQAFNVPLEDVDHYGWPDWLPGREELLPLGSAYTVQALREAQSKAMDRRSFLTIGALSLSGLAIQWAQIEPGRLASALDGKQVDDDLVAWLETTSVQLTSLPTEQRQHTNKLMDAHLATVTDLIESGTYTEHTGKRLHQLAASLATACGWYRFDQGQHSAAERLWAAALHSAHAADDRDFGAGVLSDFAYQRNWLSQPDSSLDLLDSALSRTDHPTARSLLFLRRARAHAALGGRANCFRDLSAAESELARTVQDPAPGWCAWMSPADLAVDSGQCLLDLGRSDEAHVRITEGMGLLPPTRGKTRGIFLAYAARSLLESEQVEQALAATNESLDLATRFGADRCIALVRDLVPTFQQYRKVDGVTEFMERLKTS
ncbi:helix-turn-helix transcriptional regulator [Kitasatospora sp. NPDC088134]|uniref:helix-turn-helix transcriptional regulator n=1 Tax=Kitasatospora sp. NPDC088134 TaxID=3364071 RepID=UPI0038067767